MGAGSSLAPSSRSQTPKSASASYQSLGLGSVRRRPVRCAASRASACRRSRTAGGSARRACAERPRQAAVTHERRATPRNAWPGAARRTRLRFRLARRLDGQLLGRQVANGLANHDALACKGEHAAQQAVHAVADQQHRKRNQRQPHGAHEHRLRHLVRVRKSRSQRLGARRKACCIRRARGQPPRLVHGGHGSAHSGCTECIMRVERQASAQVRPPVAGVPRRRKSPRLAAAAGGAHLLQKRPIGAASHHVRAGDAVAFARSAGGLQGAAVAAAAGCGCLLRRVRFLRARYLCGPGADCCLARGARRRPFAARRAGAALRLAAPGVPRASRLPRLAAKKAPAPEPEADEEDEEGEEYEEGEEGEARARHPQKQIQLQRAACCAVPLGPGRRARPRPRSDGPGPAPPAARG